MSSLVLNTDLNEVIYAYYGDHHTIKILSSLPGEAIHIGKFYVNA